jgi:transposase
MRRQGQHLSEEVIQKIINIMKEGGIEQKDVARRFDISSSTITAIMKKEKEKR